MGLGVGSFKLLGHGQREEPRISLLVPTVGLLVKLNVCEVF